MNNNINKNTRMLCFVGAYIRRKTRNGYYDTLTFSENYNFTYKKFIDLYTEEIFDINIDDIIEFEKNNNIIYPKVDICNLDEYHKAYRNIKKKLVLKDE